MTGPAEMGGNQQQGLPLEGIRVIDYSHFLAGPHLSRCLAAMGADVIKVERPPGGEAGRSNASIRHGQSGYFLQQNMGKRGLCLNLKDAGGRELMRRLVKTADVFVENYRPGALDRLGLGYDDVRSLNPRLIYCSVSAYGHTGPDRHKPGFGLIAEAKSGALAQLGYPGKTPPLLRMPLADMYTGMHGVAAVCAALFGRDRTGAGQHIDLALYDCMVSMHDYAVQSYFLSDGRERPEQTGSEQPDSTVYGVFTAGNGSHFVIAAQVDDAWKRLAGLIGGQELARDSRFHSQQGRNSHRGLILPLVREWAGRQASSSSAIAALEEAQIPCAPVQTIDQVAGDPQLAARNMFVDQHIEGLGTVRLPNLPFRFSGCDTSPKFPAPRLGQHNAEIAAELNFSDAEIDRLQADGVLCGDPGT